MMNQEWSLEGVNAELTDLTDVPEKALQVPLTIKLDQNTTEAVKERVTKYFSAVKLGPFSVGAPKPEDVKIAKKELKYVPFWRVRGAYACRYVRKSSYNLKVPEDVEEVRIYGRLQQLTGQRKRLSDLVSEVGAGSGLGYGPVTVTLAPLQGVMKAGLQKAFGSKDREFSRQAEVTIGEVEELASFARAVTLCLNANLRNEDKKIFEALEKVQNLEPLSKNVMEKSIPVLMGKDELRKQFKSTAVQGPDISPSRIIEQQVIIDGLELIYVPYYDLTIEAKEQRKSIRLNVLIGEDTLISGN